MDINNKCIVCLGSNSNAELHLKAAEKELNTIFSGINWGKAVHTFPEDTIHPAIYVNRIAIFYTDQSIEDIKKQFKEIEKEHGRTPSSKSTGIVPLDIDLITYGDKVLKPEDMGKKYFLKALATVNK